MMRSVRSSASVLDSPKKTLHRVASEPAMGAPSASRRYGRHVNRGQSHHRANAENERRSCVGGRDCLQTCVECWLDVDTAAGRMYFWSGRIVTEPAWKWWAGAPFRGRHRLPSRQPDNE